MPWAPEPYEYRASDAEFGMWLANLDPVAVVRELRPNALSKGEMDWYRQIYHEAENARRRKKKDPL